jgi:hypothetical protein
MTMAKLILDDEGFEILGNTLLLGYAIKRMERQKWPSGDDENSVSRLSDDRCAIVAGAYSSVVGPLKRSGEILLHGHHGPG